MLIKIFMKNQMTCTNIQTLRVAWVSKFEVFLCHLSRKLTSYFDSEILSHHAVPGCQISVDKLLGVEVRHAVCDLSCHLDHLFQSRRRTARVVLKDTRLILTL